MRFPILAPMHRRSLLLAVVVVFAVVASLSAQASAQPRFAQIDQDAPDLAPAIARWAGSPRGHFTAIQPGVGSLSLTAVAADPDSAQAIDYEILLDGAVVDRGRTPRPTSFGQTTQITSSVRVSPGVHQVCLRLADRAHPGRTVNCRQAATTPPNRADAGLANSARGVVVSPSGVVVPVTGGTANNWRVTTPCGNTASLRNGTFVHRARVVIDPGHGGSESGAVGGGIQEKNLNLDVSELVIDKFEALGISAQITRTGDYRLPIRSRANIASALAPDVFISVHHNGGALRRSSVPGTEIFYSEVRPESQRLAAILYEELHASAAQFDADWVSTVNQGASVRLNENGDDLFGVHRFSPNIDSVITEYMYLSNPSEARLLGRADVLESQAQAIVDGVLRWWFTSDPGTSLGRRFTDPSSSGTGGFDSCTDPALTGRTVGSVGLGNLERDSDALDSDALDSDAPSALADEVTVGSTSVGERSLLPQLGIGNDPALAPR